MVVKLEMPRPEFSAPSSYVASQPTTLAYLDGKFPFKGRGLQI